MRAAVDESTARGTGVELSGKTAAEVDTTILRKQSTCTVDVDAIEAIGPRPGDCHLEAVSASPLRRGKTSRPKP